jgi:iron complex outermembrane receptor protein
MSSPRIFQRKLLSIAVLGACGIGQSAIAAEASEQKFKLAPLVITATRIEQNSFDLPVAIDVVEKKDIQDGQLQMTLSESLIRIPGITAQNRNNQSQDPQISSRGFGSRSSFGVRGVRVYVDGIPLTMPDGQGQPGIVDLSIINSVEVMRGPFSALYGNSSGGVIQMRTMDAPKTAEVGATVMFGSDDTKRQIMNAAGTSENVEYLLNVSNFETAGYRNQSSGKKEQVTAKFKINFNEDTKLTTLVNWFDQTAQDPGGLRRDATTGATATPSVFTDPKGVSNASINAKTRVARSHTQIGFNLEHKINDNNAINLMTYVGTRQNMQILPASADGSNARTSEISREFYGTDLRWDNNGSVFNKNYSLSAGLNYGNSKDARLDTQTQTAFQPSNTLNRQEDNISENFDQYVQGKLAILDNVDLHAGLRRTKVSLKVKDNFLSDGDNSGTANYQKTTPVVGAVWKVTPAFNLYANFGKGFETPTFIEAAYNDTGTGATPNLSLKPSVSNNYEIGAKAYIADNTQANITLYRSTTDDELVVSKSLNGRSVYTNANTTKRSGIEFSVDSQLSNNFSAYAAYTLLDAKFTSAYTNQTTTIAAGNLIPGTYKTQLYGEISWKHDATGFNTALEARYNSKAFVNDTNTDAAPSYTIVNIRAGFKQKLANWQFSEYVRVENMFDKDYIGSVRVNDSSSRFFEAATSRNYLVGLGANYKF